MKIKRKKRNKLSKKVNFSKPIDINSLGNENDPCFGKHHSLEAEECGVCGDAQVCQIIVGQVLHTKRAEATKKQAFIDIEEQNTLKVGLLEKFMIGELSMLPNMRLTQMYVRVDRRFNVGGKITKESLKEQVKRAIHASKKIKLSKNKGGINLLSL